MGFEKKSKKKTIYIFSKPIGNPMFFFGISKKTFLKKTYVFQWVLKKQIQKKNYICFFKTHWKSYVFF